MMKTEEPMFTKLTIGNGVSVDDTRIAFFDLGVKDKDQASIRIDFHTTDIEVKRTILKYIFPSGEVTPENVKTGHHPRLSAMQCFRGVRDILIDMCEGAEFGEIEDLIVKERVIANSSLSEESNKRKIKESENGVIDKKTSPVERKRSGPRGSIARSKASN